MPPAPPSLDGSAAIGGVVYTMQLDPGLRREWRDVMSAFVWALRDCEDALLVLCLTSPEASIPQHVEAITRFHKRLSAMRHKCRILVLPDAISPEDMLRLAEGTTYHVNATRAEGACLPLQEMLAAGRPGISPAHSAMSDYFDADVGFVVESHPEPCWLPGDPTEKFRTTQHRLVWQSLHDQFQASYALARQPARYAALAERGRERMRQWAATDRVLPLLREALGPVILQAQQWPAGAPWLADRRESSGGKEDMAA
jgi:hypothetical protein